MSRVIVLVIEYPFSTCPFARPNWPPVKRMCTRMRIRSGQYNPERAWWDVLYYHLDVTPEYNTQTIKGSTEIVLRS